MADQQVTLPAAGTRGLQVFKTDLQIPKFCSDGHIGAHEKKKVLFRTINLWNEKMIPPGCRLGKVMIHERY
nr:unnamed protein product [Callosobruchus analis]